MWGLVLGLGRSLAEEMKTHSSLLALGIPWTEEPGELQFTEWDTTEATQHVAHRKGMESKEIILTNFSILLCFCNMSIKCKVIL